jgi:hypothetical protein
MLKYHIQTIQLGSGGAATIDFNSIPQDYDDLILMVSSRSNRSAETRDELQTTFNGITTGYSMRLLQGSGSGVASATGNGTAALTRMDMPTIGTTANTFSNMTIYISNYSSSTTTKSVSADTVAENNATTAWQQISAGLWNNTSPITRISCRPEVSTFTEGSSISLYGVRRGSDGKTSPVAQGGIVTTSGGYTIHTFNTSGTFTAFRPLECEYLVIAGGGGGGRSGTPWSNGGGGAGGYRSSVSGELSGANSTAEPILSFNANLSYPILVGAGGSNASDGQNSSIGSLIVSAGGGQGGSGADSGFAPAGNGGSGGGAGGSGSVKSEVPGTGTTAQGFGGSLGSGTDGSNSAGGGGGGAGQAGVRGVISSSNSVASAGKGGDGIASSITGSSVTRAGGGGGGRDNGSLFGAGGAGGGGNGGANGGGGASGAANTGGGAGGHSDFRYSYTSNGGSGVVIIRYLTP